MSDAHAEFLENPEAHAAHLTECAECRAIFAQLNAPVGHQPVDVRNLPLASWEGATYRSWTFVVVCLGLLVAVAFILSSLAGISPVNAIRTNASLAQPRAILADLSQRLQNTSLLWQIVFGCAFVGVNTLLVLLLRRPPRGIDA